MRTVLYTTVSQDKAPRYFLFFFLKIPTACGIQFPYQRLNWCPLHWMLRLSTTGPPGKGLDFLFFSLACTFQKPSSLPLCSAPHTPCTSKHQSCLPCFCLLLVLPTPAMSWLAPTYCTHLPRDPSSLKQDNGPLEQKCLASGVHFSEMFF